MTVPSRRNRGRSRREGRAGRRTGVPVAQFLGSPADWLVVVTGKATVVIDLGAAERRKLQSLGRPQKTGLAVARRARTVPAIAMPSAAVCPSGSGRSLSDRQGRGAIALLHPSLADEQQSAGRSQMERPEPVAGLGSAGRTVWPTDAGSTGHADIRWPVKALRGAGRWMPPESTPTKPDWRYPARCPGSGRKVACTRPAPTRRPR